MKMLIFHRFYWYVREKVRENVKKTMCLSLFFGGQLADEPPGPPDNLRRPTGVVAGGGEKSFGTPSIPNIIAHSFASHDTITYTKHETEMLNLAETFDWDLGSN